MEEKDLLKILNNIATSLELLNENLSTTKELVVPLAQEQIKKLDKELIIARRRIESEKGNA